MRAWASNTPARHAIKRSFSFRNYAVLFFFPEMIFTNNLLVLYLKKCLDLESTKCIYLPLPIGYSVFLKNIRAYLLFLSKDGFIF
jgi:hypothetical protein